MKNKRRDLTKQADGCGKLLIALHILLIISGCVPKEMSEPKSIIDMEKEEKQAASDVMAYSTIYVDKDGNWTKDGNIISEEDLVTYLNAMKDMWRKSEGKGGRYDVIYIKGDYHAPYGQVKRLQSIILKNGCVPAEKHDTGEPEKPDRPRSDPHIQQLNDRKPKE